MAVVNTHEAKTNLSRLIDEVQEGEEVVIARGINLWRGSFPIELSEGENKGCR